MRRLQNRREGADVSERQAYETCANAQSTGADERPLERPYMLVEDIATALAHAKAADAQIAHPAMELPGQGKFAIYIKGGIEHGIWQELSSDE